MVEVTKDFTLTLRESQKFKVSYKQKSHSQTWDLSNLGPGALRSHQDNKATSVGGSKVVVSTTNVTLRTTKVTKLSIEGQTTDLMLTFKYIYIYIYIYLTSSQWLGLQELHSHHYQLILPQTWHEQLQKKQYKTQYRKELYYLALYYWTSCSKMQKFYIYQYAGDSTTNMT